MWLGIKFHGELGLMETIAQFKLHSRNKGSGVWCYPMVIHNLLYFLK
jgi:hypothetical protein